jgi:peptidoglycan/xylan/chitin deacetylase (PgdA/CDA1 family)
MGTFKAIGLVKGWARRCAAELYALSPGYLNCLQGKVVILTYHRVVSNKELELEHIQPGMYVTADTFAMHMQFLKQHFSVIPFAELLRLWSDQQWSLDQPYCVVTFDDGWLDNYVHALPVLRRFAVPATVFLPTTFVGTAKWFWPEQVAWLCRHRICHSEDERRRVVGILKKKHTWLISVEASMRAGDTEGIIEGCKALQQDQIDTFVAEWAAQLGVVLPGDRQVINWGEAQEMSAAGISFGSHSATHRIMTRLNATELAQEISGSWATLREKPITTVPVFCYPNGNWSAEVERLVEAAGYAAATSAEFGYEGRVPLSRFGLKRINIHDDVTNTPTLFAFHLAGYNRVGMG